MRSIRTTLCPFADLFMFLGRLFSSPLRETKMSGLSGWALISYAHRSARSAVSTDDHYQHTLSTAAAKTTMKPLIESLLLKFCWFSPGTMNGSKGQLMGEFNAYKLPDGVLLCIHAYLCLAALALAINVL